MELRRVSKIWSNCYQVYSSFKCLERLMAYKILNDKIRVL